MCGICGIVGSVDEDVLLDMLDIMKHRGLDGKGTFINDTIALGAVRLAIIDIPGGQQPIWNEGEAACIIFNREIYNYSLLKDDLLSNGHVFRTETDTEVVLHLYEEMGSSCVNVLDGMFAFAIWDGTSLFLARDPMGIKPLYYSYVESEDTFLFASEIKGLLRHPVVNAVISERSMVEQYVFGYPLAGRTLFDFIEEVKPGSTLTVRPRGSNGKIELEADIYFSLRFEPDYSRSLEQTTDQLIELLRSSVIERIEHAEVPYSLLLSGGIDSTLIAFFGKDIVEKPMCTLTVFDNHKRSDSYHSRKVADVLCSRHTEVPVQPDSILRGIIDTIWVQEEMHLSLPILNLMEACGDDIKIVLCGEGADEIFGGYWFHLKRELYRRNILRKAKWIGSRPSDYLADLGSELEQLFRERVPDHSLRNISHFNLHEQLVYMHLLPFDKCGMGCGIEVRVPYLSQPLIEFACTIPDTFRIRGEVQKYVLRRAALQTLPRDMVHVIFRDKMALPESEGRVRERLHLICDNIVGDEYAQSHPYGELLQTKLKIFAFDLLNFIFVENRGGRLDEIPVSDILGALYERNG